MTVPPSNPPPGGYYYGQPPQRPANNNAGCLKAFGITCGVLILLSIIGGVFLYKASAPFLQKAMGLGQDSMHGKQIQKAVVAYHQRNGKYPPNLTALVGDGEIPDPRILHSDQDPSPNPGHISWRYTRPPENTPIAAPVPILSLPYSITVLNQTQRAELSINLDGSASHTPSTSPVPSPGAGT